MSGTSAGDSGSARNSRRAAAPGRSGFDSASREERPVQRGHVTHRFRISRERLGHERVERGARSDRPERFRGAVREAVVIQFHEDIPWAEEGVGWVAVRQKVVPPATNGCGDDVVGAQELVEALLRVFVEFELGDEVVGEARSQARVGFLAPFGVALVEGLPAFGKFGILGLIQRDESDIGATEDAIERVVVLDRDGIVFVIVATRALNRESEGAAGDDVDAVIDDVVGDSQETPAAREESHGGEVGGIGLNELVGGDLEEEEAIVGHVLVEGLDDPVAVGGGMDEEAFLAGVHVALGVGVAGDVEPVATPSFAVVGTVEESLDQAGDGGGIGAVGGRSGGLGFGGEFLDFLIRGGQACECFGEATDQGARVGGRSGFGAFRFEFGEDEAVDLVPGPAGVADGGRLDGLEGLIGPMKVGVGRRFEGGAGERKTRAESEGQGESDEADKALEPESHGSFGRNAMEVCREN